MLQHCCRLHAPVSVQVILETATKEKQKTEVEALSAMVAGAPFRHVSTALCCIVFAICVSCNPFHMNNPVLLQDVAGITALCYQSTKQLLPLLLLLLPLLTQHCEE
jgi:hypothetical protein